VGRDALSVVAPVRLACLAVAGLLVLAAAGWAAEPTPTTTAPAASVEAPTGPAAVPTQAIPGAAEQALRELAELRQWAAADPPVDQIALDVRARSDAVRRLAAEAPLEPGGAMSVRELEDLAREWYRMRDELAQAADVAARRIQVLEAALGRVEELDAVWRLTAESAGKEQLPDAVIREIAAVRAAIRDTQAALKKDRDALLVAASQLAALRAQVDEQMAELHAAQARAGRGLLGLQSPPLWTVLRGPLSEEPLGEALRRGFGRSLTRLRDYAATRRGRIVGYLVGLVVALALTFDLRRRVRHWPPGDDAALEVVRPVADRPISAAVLVVLLIGILAQPRAPVVLTEVGALAGLVPLFRLLQNRFHGRLATFVPVYGVLFMISLVRRALPPLSPASRVTLAIDTIIAAAWLLWAMRPAEIDGLGLSERSRQLLTRAVWVVLGLLGISMIANLIGAVLLGQVITQGVLASGFLGLGLFTTASVLQALLLAHLSPARSYRLASVGHSVLTLRRHAMRAVRVAAVAAWIYGMLASFSLLDRTWRGLRAALSAELPGGILPISLGDVLAFALAVWLAFVLARIVRALLEDDILPRLDLPRGVPTAVSAAANYTILFLGILFALSLAGIDVSRITLVASALGVGIGFGLQNVVNNFVSGVILLIERPVRIGDVIEFGPPAGSVTGYVRRIGIRSSTIRTFDGAEVIVPNGTLIAERLTNWTFSGFQRRIEIKVSVADGSDPEKVRALLEEVAKGQPDLLTSPPPQALVLGFGGGHIELALRAWTARFDAAAEVHGRIAAALLVALRSAGVEIR
jgi:small-conductance mechanosensitive channel